MTNGVNAILKGTSISAGIAIGRAFVYRDINWRNHELYDIQKEQVDEEYDRVVQAISKVQKDLDLSAQRIEKDLTAELAEIFHAQKSILEDKKLLEEIRKELEDELVNAEQIVKIVFHRWIRKFRQVENVVISKRADDMDDLCRRLLKTLTGIRAHTLETIPDGSVLVAKELLPSDTIFLSRKSVVGVIVEAGSSSSHTGLLTRAIGIPSVGHIPQIFKKIKSGQELIVDGSNGSIIIDPNSEKRKHYQQQLKAFRQSSAKARKHCHEEAKTKDGITIKILANVNCQEDVEISLQNGAEGIGLYRTEGFYLGQRIMPSKEELIAHMKTTLEPAKGKTIHIRLLDVGGDKDLPFINLPDDPSPFLGRRGIRLLLHYPDLLHTQLQAILSLSNNFSFRILVPMVTLADELRQTRETLQKIANTMKIKAIPPLGAMIETPAAALCVANLARYADFFSIGTNDLTQYTMAAGRENSLVSDYFRDDHSSVFKLIELVVQETKSHSIAVCGELAGNPQTIPALVRTGIRCLSVAPPSIPAVKEAVRSVDLFHSKQLLWKSFRYQII